MLVFNLTKQCSEAIWLALHDLIFFTFHLLLLLNIIYFFRWITFAAEWFLRWEYIAYSRDEALTFSKLGLRRMHFSFFIRHFTAIFLSDNAIFALIKFYFLKADIALLKISGFILHLNRTIVLSNFLNNSQLWINISLHLYSWQFSERLSLLLSSSSTLIQQAFIWSMRINSMWSVLFPFLVFIKITDLYFSVDWILSE